MRYPALVSRAVNTLSAGRLKLGWWGSAYESRQRPILVGGCDRSGTTLLRTILTSHRNVFVGEETGLLCGNRDLGHLSRCTGIALKGMEALYRRSSCLGEFVDSVMRECLAAEGKPQWGEKTPANVRHLDLIFKFFPNARFVHIVRDGRDVVCSLRHHPDRWVDGRRPSLRVTNAWDDCVRRWVDSVSAGRGRRGDARYREIRYEDLIASPRQQIRSLLEWLDQPWDEQVLGFFKNHREAWGDVANPGVKKPIYATASGRWKQDLPPEARRTFTSAARSLLRELGYAADDSWAAS